MVRPPSVNSTTLCVLISLYSPLRAHTHWLVAREASLIIPSRLGWFVSSCEARILCSLRLTASPHCVISKAGEGVYDLGKTLAIICRHIIARY